MEEKRKELNRSFEPLGMNLGRGHGVNPCHRFGLNAVRLELLNIAQPAEDRLKAGV